MADARVFIKCPKCKSESFELYETFEEIEIREVVDGWLPKERIDHEAGGRLSASCRCSRCVHKWQLRSGGLAALDAADYPQASRRTHRASVLEEAAKACGDVADTNFYEASTANACSEAIRALAAQAQEGKP